MQIRDDADLTGLAGWRDRTAVSTTRWLAPFVLCFLAACPGDDDPGTRTWQVVGRDLPGALLSIWGSSSSDVYAVGGDTGDGPTVVHYDGTAWTHLATGQHGNLWWVHGFAGGPIFMGGDGGMVLRYENGTFTKLMTPGTDTVFGIWGSGPTDVWAVGGAQGGASGAFAWQLQGDAMVAAPAFPSSLAGSSAIWKMYGRSATDAWMVGTNGTTVRLDGTTLTTVAAGIGESLFTVHGDASRYVAVGGFGTGLILENTDGTWVDVSPTDRVPGLVGVHMSAKGSYAVGQDGTVLSRGDTAWQQEDIGFNVDETFHSVWVDPDGGTWVAGGQVQVLPLVDGIMLYSGPETVGNYEGPSVRVGLRAGKLARRWLRWARR